MSASADTLTVTSRTFYERTKSKLALSIITGAAAMLLLGFCAAAGGQSSSANSMMNVTTGDQKDAQQSLAGGFGFASFCFIIAFILLTSAAIYISPLMCGSNNEKKMIRSPEEIDSSYAAYNEQPGQNQV